MQNAITAYSKSLTYQRQKAENTFGVSMEFAVGDHASDFRSLAFGAREY
jgi:hypothetical protein